jgi:glyoxylase-like metal-dependent hydrolase (beta-lactamase superfamily II)
VFGARWPSPGEKARARNGYLPFRASDGFLTLPISIVAPEAAPHEQTDIIRRLGGSADTVQPRANIPLIRVGQELILIDTGSGDKFQPTAGRLTANLAAAGVDPASVTKVVCTHAHPDHIGGTLAPGAGLTFPNATWAGGEGLIITGDAVTNHIVSFEYPGQKFGFDMQHDVAM